MATVKIRGRRDKIVIDDSRARALKNRKFGLNGKAKAESFDLVDLGEWAGEYGAIVEIEVTRLGETPEKSITEKRAEKEKKEQEQWQKMTPEEKGRQTGRFSLIYSTRTGDYKAQPPQDVLDEVIKIQTDFYKKETKERFVPIDLFKHLLPPKKAESLADRLSMKDAKKPNGRKCKKCSQELTGNLKEYCSGSCMVADKNGEISTSE